MKKYRLAVIVLLFAMLLSLFGCSKKHLLDGPGMVNDQPWKGFILSHTDSHAGHNFSFEVQRSDIGYMLTGECRDAAGKAYELTAEDGFLLSAEDMQYLRGLWLGDLEDVPEGDTAEVQTGPQLVLVMINGEELEKSLPEETSIEMYQ